MFTARTRAAAAAVAMLGLAIAGVMFVNRDAEKPSPPAQPEASEAEVQAPSRPAAEPSPVAREDASKDAVTLEGIVLGPDGAPYRGAALSARGPAASQEIVGTAVSGPGGEFALQVPAEAFPLRLHASGAGCREAVVDVAREDDHDLLTIRLQADRLQERPSGGPTVRAIVRGRAVEVGADGAPLAPIANAEVYCVAPEAWSRVYTSRFLDKEPYLRVAIKSVTDASGAFEMAVEATREPYVILLSDPWLQWREWPMVVLDGPEPEAVLVQAQRGLEVKVSARLATGEDLPGPASLYVDAREGGKHLTERRLRPGGSVSLCLPPGDYRLLCGCLSSSIQWQGRADLTLVAGSGATDLCITLEPKEPEPPRFRHVRGQIYDTQGSPMSLRELGVNDEFQQVELSVKRPAAAAPSHRRQVLIDGSFHVSVPVAAHEAAGLFVELRIGEFVTQAPVPADGSEVRLVVPRDVLETGFASLTVDVVAAGSGEAMPGACVTLRLAEHGRWIRVLADEKGRAVICGLPGGECELVAGAIRHGAVRQRVVLAPRQDRSIVVELPSAVTVDCEVVPWEAARAGEVMISLIAPGDEPGAGVRWLGRVREGGHCVFEHLAPGRYRAVAIAVAGSRTSEARAWPVMGQTIVVDERPVQKVTLACRWEESKEVEVEILGGQAAPRGALSLEFAGSAGDVLGGWVLPLPMSSEAVRLCLPAGTRSVRFGPCDATSFPLFPCGDMREQSVPVAADGRFECVSIDVSTLFGKGEAAGK